MVTIQQKSMLDSIADGISQAKKLGQPILVSSTMSMDFIDPLIFYIAGKHLFFGERFFWKEPHQGVTFVGLGAAQVIETYEPASNRFQHVELEWKNVLKNSIQNKNSKSVGPMLFGGFSFDPTKKSTGTWDHFPESKFYLPKYMLSIENGHARFTTNLLVTAIDEPEKIYEHIMVEKKKLLHLNNDDSYMMTHDFTVEEIEVEEWMESVATVISHINEGKLEKAVLARELKLFSEKAFHIASILHHLEQQQPNSYLFAMESGAATFVGATPERLIKKEDEQLLSTCLAGSIRRGNSKEEDKRLEIELLKDVKNLEEHQFVVQMITQELNQVCKSITTASHPAIFKAKDIQHLYTPIVGMVKDNVHLLSIVERLHPTPALGGFPQDKALVEIREQELLDRGWYAGPIGWIDGAGNGEFAVAIRSGLIQQNEASLFAGCGIVGKSEPSKEYEETQIKFKPMLTAIGGKFNG
jgi:menaquinone-specific isochorismate synthase